VVTNAMFGKVGAGGLGLAPETFFEQTYGGGNAGTIKPFQASGGVHPDNEGFPLQDSVVQWIGRTDPAGIRTASCGYG
jgi:hypothetical protein